MAKFFPLLLVCLVFSLAGKSQWPVQDTIPRTTTDSTAADDLLDEDLLMSDLADFLDSLLKPNSFFTVNAAVTRGYYNYKITSSSRLQSVAKSTWSPSIGYYHKKGPGISATAFIINDRTKLNLYQFSVTPSYDYLGNTNFVTGVSYTRYFSKDSLAFYISPLQNELSTYFTWRKWWVQPSVSLSYAWGSDVDLAARLSFIESLRLRRRIINLLGGRYQSVNDFSVTASILHNFYWLELLDKKDKLRITPQFIFSAGSQQYGFNQQAHTTSVTKLTRDNLLNNARSYSLSGNKTFKPLSLSFNLGVEYGFGKFFVHPRFLLDYYFPAKENNLAALFSVSTGFIF